MKYILEIDPDKSVNINIDFGEENSRCPCLHKDFLDGPDEDYDLMCSVTGYQCHGVIQEPLPEGCPLKVVLM